MNQGDIPYSHDACAVRVGNWKMWKESETRWGRYENVPLTEILIGLGFAGLLLCLVSLSKQIKNFSNLCKSARVINSLPFNTACLTFKYSSDGAKSLFAALVATGTQCATLCCTVRRVFCHGNRSNFQLAFKEARNTRATSAVGEHKTTRATPAHGRVFAPHYNTRALTRDAPDRPYCLSLTLNVFDERLLWKRHGLTSHIFKCGVISLFLLSQLTQGTSVLGWTCC